MPENAQTAVLTLVNDHDFDTGVFQSGGQESVVQQYDKQPDVGRTSHSSYQLKKLNLGAGPEIARRDMKNISHGLDRLYLCKALLVS